MIKIVSMWNELNWTKTNLELLDLNWMRSLERETIMSTEQKIEILLSLLSCYCFQIYDCCVFFHLFWQILRQAFSLSSSLLKVKWMSCYDLQTLICFSFYFHRSSSCTSCTSSKNKTTAIFDLTIKCLI